MANVNFKEGTLEEYLNITPDEHTFYKATQDDGNEDKVYLGAVQLSNDGIDLQALLDQLQDLEERVYDLENPFYLFPGYTVEQVVDIVDQGEAENYWSVGETTNFIPLNGSVSSYNFDNEQYKAMVIGFDHNIFVETDRCHNMVFQFGENEDGVKICFTHPNHDGDHGAGTSGFKMNDSDTNSGGWESSWMRTGILPAFFEALPKQLKQYISMTTKYTDNVGGTSNLEENITATEDKIFLLAVSEITFSSAMNVNSYESNYTQRYDWYANNNSNNARIRYKHFDISSSSAWWLRSPSCSSNESFYDVWTSGSFNQNSGWYSFGLAPIFNINGSTSIKTNLSTMNPEEIQSIVESGQAANVWSVGDLTAPIELNGDVSTYTFDHESFRAMLIGLDHNMDLETDGKHNACFQFGQTEDGINICFRDPNYDGGSSSSKTGFRMNDSDTNSGGWESCWMRTEILPEFFEALPAEWQEIISPTTKYTDNVGGTSNLEENITATEDKIFLLAETEIFSSDTYANSYESNYTQRYDWYANNDSNEARIRYKHFDISSSSAWWLRSPYRSYSYYFCDVFSTGIAHYAYAYYSYGFAPAFTIF